MVAKDHEEGAAEDPAVTWDNVIVQEARLPPQRHKTARTPEQSKLHLRNSAKRVQPLMLQLSLHIDLDQLPKRIRLLVVAVVPVPMTAIVVVLVLVVVTAVVTVQVAKGRSEAVSSDRKSVSSPSA